MDQTKQHLAGTRAKADGTPHPGTLSITNTETFVLAIINWFQEDKKRGWQRVGGLGRCFYEERGLRNYMSHRGICYRLGRKERKWRHLHWPRFGFPLKGLSLFLLMSSIWGPCNLCHAVASLSPLSLGKIMANTLGDTVPQCSIEAEPE